MVSTDSFGYDSQHVNCNQYQAPSDLDVSWIFLNFHILQNNFNDMHDSLKATNLPELVLNIILTIIIEKYGQPNQISKGTAQYFRCHIFEIC